MRALLEKKFEIACHRVELDSALVGDLGIEAADIEYLALTQKAAFDIDITTDDAAHLVGVRNARAPRSNVPRSIAGPKQAEAIGRNASLGVHLGHSLLQHAQVRVLEQVSHVAHGRRECIGHGLDRE